MAVRFFYLIILFVGFSYSRQVSSSPKFSNLDYKNILALGNFDVRDHESPFAITAPHGRNDYQTDKIVSTICHSLKWDCIIAKHYRHQDHPINVNRPTEGIGLSPDEEVHSQRAELVYKAYRDTTNLISPIQNRKLYVEVHGNSRPQLANNIEIALVNFSLEQSELVKSIFETQLRDSSDYSPASSVLRSVEILVEGADHITLQATGSKHSGMLGEVAKSKTKAIHIEIPKKLRLRKELQSTTEFLRKSLEALGEVL